MIYTGYFAKTKDYEKAGLIPVSVAGKAPSFYEGMTYPDFAPRLEMFKKWKNGEINDFQYTEEYINYLNSLDKDEIREDFNSPNKCNNMILLCYEKSGNFCHRHILADWLEENFKYRVEEYKI